VRRFFSEHIDIGGRTVGEKSPCLVVAEAGVAHFGDLGKALRLVDMAAKAGAEMIKFQLFDVDALIAVSCHEWRERLGGRRLTPEQMMKVRDHCCTRNIQFLATAHDLPSLEALDSLEVPAYKVGSGELANWDFIRKVAERGKPVILSTGMYSEGDVKNALEVFRDVGNPDVVLLHCVTQYPTPPEDVNLRAMDTLRERFGAITGYSDHTEGIHFPLAAVARGARVVEKHISLDFHVPNAQDWKVSCDEASLAALVTQVRRVEAGLGHGRKEPVEGELRNLAWARKSLVSRRGIPEGTSITGDMLDAKRPGTGIPPNERGRVVGRTAAFHIEADTLITWEMIK